MSLKKVFFPPLPKPILEKITSKHKTPCLLTDWEKSVAYAPLN